MKKTALLILVQLVSYSVISQDISGYWNGMLKVQEKQYRIGFEVSKMDSSYSTFMDSPDQGVNRIRVTKTTLKDRIVKFEISGSKVEYTGIMGQSDSILGNLKQGEQLFPINFTKGMADTLIRPQIPRGPFLYYSEEVQFENKTEKIMLAGTLTLPRKTGLFPVVVLISDKGAQNRNQEMYDHKSFLVLADYLTRNGIGVFRFDDRGTGQSKGEFKTATTADFKTDVEAAIAYLQTRKEINKEFIGLIGHGEGAMIAPQVAAKNSGINFIVLMAGMGISGDKLLLAGEESIARAKGIKDNEIKKNLAINKGAYEIVTKSNSTEKIKNQLKVYLKEALKDSAEIAASKIVTGVVKIDSSRINISTSDSIRFAKLDSIQAVKTQQKLLKREKLINAQIEELTHPWMQYFIRYNPQIALEKVKCPILILNGSKDLEVSALVNLDAIVAALKKGGNREYDSKAFPNLNHLFQTCKTGLPNEYGQLEQTISPLVLSEISKWIKLKTTPLNN